jgi:hypothetical protein
MTYPSEVPPEPDSYRGPGYPLLIALAIKLGGDDKGYNYVLFIQAILSALSVALAIAIARQWLAFSYALAVGVLVAVWPHLVSLQGNVLTETFFGFSLLLGVYLLGGAVSRQGLYLYALAGLAFAYAALINPAILLFPPLAAAAIAFFRRKYLVIFLCCSLSLPVAWSVRSAMLESGKSTSGRLVENILAGSEPDFNYDYSANTQASRERVWAKMEQYEGDIMGALGSLVDQFSDSPAYYASWYLLQKPVRFWQWNILGDPDIYVYPVIASPFQTHTLYRVIISICSSLNLILMAAAFGFVLVFAVRGFRRRFQEQDVPLLLVTLLFVYATLLHSVLVPDPRYSTPFRPFEILIALTLVSIIHGRVQASRPRGADPC